MTQKRAYDEQDEEAVARAVEMAHSDYHIHREYATDKGFADLVMIPRRRWQSTPVTFSSLPSTTTLIPSSTPAR